LSGRKKADASRAAESLLQSQAEYIVAVREPLKPKGKAERQRDVEKTSP
jgi:hypothetical protein